MLAVPLVGGALYVQVQSAPTSASKPPAAHVLLVQDRLRRERAEVIRHG